MGTILEDMILPFPRLPESEKETLETVFSTLEQLFEPREKDFVTWDRKGEFPPEFIAQLREAGLFSFVIPEEHGGLGSAVKRTRARSRKSRATTPPSP
jgi:alkylation response protein AidB-like acyl-CoA dehydrogenase